MSAHKYNNEIYRINLTPIGKIIDYEINQLEKRFPMKIEKYVIMPNHIHFIINLCVLKWNENEKYDVSRVDTRPTPTIGEIICSFKSITSNQYIKYNKKNGEYKKLWQRNYYERIIRNRNEYYGICEYIKNNPVKYIEKYKWNINKKTKLFIDNFFALW